MVLAFLVGVAVGVVLGRRSTAERPTPPTAPVPVAPPPSVTPGSPVVTKRGRKAGLSEASFQPSDDILERLRRVEAGELDPSQLHDAPAAPAAEPSTPPVLPTDPELAERERRILERLERERQSDFSKQRESGEER